MNNQRIVDYPITAIIGDRGAGKTLYATALAEAYFEQGKQIVSNYHLYEVDYIYMTFEDLVKDFHTLYNAVVFLDELQVGAGAFNYLKKENQQIGDFVTQIRKRKITIYFTTQRYKRITIQVREQVDYIIQVERLEIAGTSLLTMFQLPWVNRALKQWIFDGRPYFGHYDTEQIITFTGKKDITEDDIDDDLEDDDLDD
jgi:ABC-type dipeptide/oligopeptide/nickel transport system ATPase component